MKRLLLVLCLICSTVVFAQGSVVITADTAVDVFSLGVFGPGRAGGVAFSPNGKLIAVASTIGVKLYETGVFGSEDLLFSEGFAASSVSFDPTGSVLVAVNAGYNVQQYDPDSGELLSSEYPPALEGAFNIVVYSPLGTSYALNTSTTLSVIDTATEQTLFASPGHVSAISSINYSPDGTRIATASYDATVNLWDAFTGEHQITLTGHADSVLAAAFSADGLQVITASIDGTARVWDAATGAETAVLAEAEGGFSAVAVSSIGTIALGRADGTVSLITGEGETVLGTHGEPVGTMAFSPDSLLLVSSTPGSVRLWDTVSQGEIGAIGFEPSFTAIAINPDGSKVAAGGVDGMVYVFDAITGEVYSTTQVGQPPITGLVFDLNSDTVYVANAENLITEIEATTGEVVGNLEATGAVVDMSRHPSQPMINAVTDDAALRWWNTDDGNILGSATPHTGQTNATAFSPDGVWMASADATGEIYIWRVEIGDVDYTLQAGAQVNAMAFTSDGTILAAGLDDGRIVFWRFTEPIDPFMTVEGFSNAITGVAYSPDSSVLAGTSFDGTLRLFNAQTGEQLTSLYDQSAPVLDLVFSPDGTRIYSVGDNGAVVMHGIFQ